MRAIVFIVVGVAVAVLSALFYTRFGGVEKSPLDGERSGADTERFRRVESALKENGERLQRLERLTAALEDAVLRAAESSTPKGGAPAPSHGDSSLSSNPTEAKPVPATAQVAENERLRQLVREEIKRAKEEETKRWREQGKMEQPEEWEKREFENYAWYVHQRGKELSLTEAQKRRYYAIIKDYYDRTQALWGDLQKENPGGDWRKLGELYRERSGEMLKSTRELVLRILDEEQQKKYREMFEDNEWYR